VKRNVTFLVAALAACGGSPSAPRFVESSLVAAGRVRDQAGGPVREAIVMIDAMTAGKPGGEFGCTGAYLTGNWVAFTDADGRFTVGMGQQSDGRPICVVVFAVPAGDSDTTWRDTAFVLRRFTPVAPGVAPDTVHFDLRVLSPVSATQGGR
jgi:hypothetical protein